MLDSEILELATMIVKMNQRYFWAPERRGERIKITKAANVIKDIGRCGYAIVKNEQGVE